MVFTQQVNFGVNMANSQEFMKICSEHLQCVGCPLKDKDVQLQGGLTRCEMVRMKGDKK